MRILIAGGAGMLGHQLLLHLRAAHEVKVTLRQDLAHYAGGRLFNASNAYGGVDARTAQHMAAVVTDFRPDAIINCIGIVKQLPIAKESIPSIEINALLPHRLAQVAAAAGARLLHFSTDCVCSGRKGNYVESDLPDPEDTYGRTKLLGELPYENALTLRTSVIGHELDRKTSLLEWFLAQKGQVRGFRKAIFSGFTTLEMARIVETVLTRQSGAHGVWHVSSDPIDKYALLNLIKKYYGVDVEIAPDDELRCDRSLDSARFRERFDYRPPSWDRMIEEMSRTRGYQ